VVELDWCFGFECGTHESEHPVIELAHPPFIAAFADSIGKDDFKPLPLHSFATLDLFARAPMDVAPAQPDRVVQPHRISDLFGNDVLLIEGLAAFASPHTFAGRRDHAFARPRSSGRLVALDGGAEIREGHVQRQGDLPDGRP
jgi:hypothetical protein